MLGEQQRRPGRPSKGLEREVRLPEDYWEWMKDPSPQGGRRHGLSYSDVIRYALDQICGKRQHPLMAYVFWSGDPNHVEFQGWNVTAYGFDGTDLDLTIPLNSTNPMEANQELEKRAKYFLDESFRSLGLGHYHVTVLR